MIFVLIFLLLVFQTTFDFETIFYLENRILKQNKRLSSIVIYASGHNRGCRTLQRIQSKVMARIKFGFMFADKLSDISEIRRFYRYFHK